VNRRLLAVAALLLLASGCEEPRPAERPAPVRSSAFRPELFPDIPAPPGFAPVPDREHLAFALAGGEVRRYDVVLGLRVGLPDDGQPELGLVELGRRLNANGWNEESAGRWRKGAERLQAETGHAGDRPSIRVRLWPADPPTPAP
jgi:hypothetical protein